MSLIITLAVEDLDRSEYFYRNILQLPVERYTTPSTIIIRQGDATILLRDLREVTAEHPIALQHLHRQPLGVGISIELQIDNLAQILHCIAREQINYVYEIEDQEHRVHEIWLYDPDNYLIMLTQHL